MRGKPATMYLTYSDGGITPADAGKTNRHKCRVHSSEDHPRGCGENVVCNLNRPCITGSPPRMRGKRSGMGLGLCITRITPADAGKTNVTYKKFCNYWDHPRGCGENQCPAFKAACIFGSPPRMRGKPLRAVLIVVDIGITPADAGKTYLQAIIFCVTWDHPRGCGENSGAHGRTLSQAGSPPRMRGKQPILGINVHAVRITPADAGKTPQLPPVCLST